VAYPSKRENILESLRNFQRVHLNACASTSDDIKTKYADIVRRGNGPRRSQRLVRAYYAQAAAEVGLVDTPNGIVYNEANDCRKSGKGPSEEMLKILAAAREEEIHGPHRARAATVAGAALRASLSPKKAKASSSKGHKDTDVKYGKFANVASDETCRIVQEARGISTAFVQPSDFDTVSDYIYLLFHQLEPCRPTAATIKRRRLDPAHLNCLTGLCCRHCSKADGINGMYFPLNIDSLGDSSFSQTLGMHMSTCLHAPEKLISALDELKALGKDHNSCARRGSKKAFIEKVWGRILAISGSQQMCSTDCKE
jgi:hypothetical protein